MAAVDRGPGDAALWSLAAHGDHDAFGQLFDRHAGTVYSYLFRLTANWSEAEDLTSAVFLQAWRRRAQVVIDRDSSHEREAVELCVWAELDQQAAAVSLGVKVGTVKSRLHRARRRLATELGATGGEPAAAPPPRREEP
jgi:DNA-directed RNA polymerase specialized sigma24 family protein